jgi:4-hydroxy-tetrahydrodipicolinate synthase
MESNGILWNNGDIVNAMRADLSKKPKLRGVFAPTVTAFHDDGSINPEGTAAYARFLVDQGVDGLTPLGSAGEPVALNLTERKKLLEAIVDEVSGKIPIYAGTSDYSTASTIELSLHARSIGCDGLMLMAPFLLRPPKQDVLNHFRRIREKVGLPIMLYNVPILLGIEITPEEIQRLAEEDVIHTVKWSHAEISRVQDTRLLCGPDFPIFAGIDLIAFSALALGAEGWIGGLPMMVPALAVRLHRLLTEENNLEEARKLWNRLLPIVRIEYKALGTAEASPHWLAVCRESAVLRGIPVGISRPPLSPLDSANSEELRSVLFELGELEGVSTSLVGERNSKR